jgi:hypothetical protein
VGTSIKSQIFPEMQASICMCRNGRRARGVGTVISICGLEASVRAVMEASIVSLLYV